MIKQLGFLFHLDRCVGCNACALRCLSENNQGMNKSYRKVKLINNDHFLSLACNHCDSPECFRTCPQNAFVKRRDGIVELDIDLCDGCGLCISVCPYEAIQYNPETRKVEKCNLCNFKHSRKTIPSCVQACTTSALELIDLYEEVDKASVTTIEGIPSPKMTKPSIRFIPQKLKKRYWNR